jgi:hypothetical protein
VWRWMMYIKSRVGRGWALSWNILKYFPSIIVEQLSRRRKNAGFSQDVFSLIAEWGRYFEGWPVSVLRTGVAYGGVRLPTPCSDSREWNTPSPIVEAFW